MTTLLRPGDRFAGHEILSHLGAGRSANVYTARAPAGGLCALKIMADKAGPTSKLWARFAQEGEAITSIVHPNVVCLYDAGVWNGQLFLSLELVEGETLGQKLRSGVRLPLDDILHWIQQACDGLAEAHRVGVVHRDLTPDNILIAPNGSVKVIDFGLAKLRKWGVQTTKKLPLGSAMYMSPEQALSAPASASMDIYSIGLVLYEAVAGVHAIGPEELPLARVMAWQLSGRPRPLRDLVPEVPPDLEALIHKALAKDPGKRPASMAAFNASLRTVRGRLRAPQRRAARNVPQPDRGEALSPTMPMPVQASAESTPAETAHDMAAHEREAMLPVAPLTPAAHPTMPVASLRAEQSALCPAALPELRSTDAPVETTAKRSTTVPPRLVLGAAVMAGAGLLTAVAASGWMLFGHVLGTPREPAPAPHPAASAPPAPTATASATASAPPAAPRPPAATAFGAKGPQATPTHSAVRAPAKPPGRPPAKN